MLEVVFLGTGSGIPSTRRNPAGLFLRHGGESMLWDCGEGTQKRLMKSGLSFMKIDRIFITHWHADHWAGLLGLMQTMSLERRKKNLYIYGPEAEMFVDKLLSLDYWGPRFRIIPKNVPYRGEGMTTVYKTKEFQIDSIPVEHTVPSVAYAFKQTDRWRVDMAKAQALYGLRQSPLVGKLKDAGEVVFKGQKIRLEDVGELSGGLKVVYSGDTLMCQNLEKLAKDADVFICDATFDEEKEGRMHSGAKEAARMAKKAAVKNLVLTHFSRRYLDVRPLVDDAKKIFPMTMAAEDLLMLKIKDSGMEAGRLK
ncbi:MAG: ribonuclease Z [Candidatus Aenigmatarchaeota archaeon]